MNTTTFAALITLGLIVLWALAYLLDWSEGIAQDRSEAPPAGDVPRCKICRHPLTWVDCWMCNPDDGDDCEECDNNGGWFVCFVCDPEPKQDKESIYAAH